jgi:hypothetical protein
MAPFGYGRVERILVTQSATGRTGQWWCTNNFGNNLGGWWKCRGVSGGNVCGATVPNGELVSCSEYSNVQTVNVAQNYAPGRTGQWWCTNNFGNNLGGTWDCLAVAGGSCDADAPNGANVTCGQYTAVDETPFAPPACNAPSMDGAETQFCMYTEYMTTRTAATAYLFNDYLRAGFNRSFGGALFELYGSDKVNLIEEHGGSAAQLSMWGYDVTASGAGYFTTTGGASTSCPGIQACNPMAFGDAATCKAANGNVDCKEFPTSGAQISDCKTELACPDWSAAAPWNPIQGQAACCGWNGPTNDVDQVTEQGGNVTFTKSAPYQFTKTTAFSGLTWSVTGSVASDKPYLRATYQVSYASARDVGEHNQEIPALFTDATISHWYYYYGGPSPYADVSGLVTRLRADFGSELVLPSRAAPAPQPPPTTPHAATEEWMTVCSRDESQCLTIASFAPEVKVLVQGGQYVTPLGRLGFGTSLAMTWDVIMFPYRYDDVVAGKSVRQWIYDLKGP